MNRLSSLILDGCCCMAKLLVSSCRCSSHELLITILLCLLLWGLFVCKSIRLPLCNPAEEINKAGGGINNSHNVNNQLPRKMTDFRRRYRLWSDFYSIQLGQAAASTVPRRYLIHRCEHLSLEKCTNWMSTVDGMILGHIIANSTRRTLKAESLVPGCNFLRYITPNKVNWSIQDHFQVGLSSRISSIRQRHINDIETLLRLSSVDHAEGRSYYSNYTYFITDDFEDGLREFLKHLPQLSWMQSLSSIEIRALFYKQLFKLSPKLAVRLDSFLRTNLPTKHHRLLCSHIAMSHLARKYQNTLKHLSVVWKFFQDNSRPSTDKIFVMSESEKVLKNASSQGFRESLIHPRPSRRKASAYSMHILGKCRKFEKLILELHLLMNCDVLVVSEDRLSHLAASVRASDEGLFCFFDHGALIPCRRESLMNLYTLDREAFVYLPRCPVQFWPPYCRYFVVFVGGILLVTLYVYIYAEDKRRKRMSRFKKGPFTYNMDKF